MHTIKFENEGCSIKVNPADYPLYDHGEPGSILDIALANDIHIEHNCGGVGACSTCVVDVVAGAKNLSPLEEDEEDMLDRADDLTLNSRLACCAVVNGDITVKTKT